MSAQSQVIEHPASSSVPSVRVPHETPVEKAHREAGEVVAELQEIDHRHDKVFAKLQRVKADCLKAGSRFDPIMSASVKGAYRGYRNPDDVGEAPLDLS